MIDLAVNNDDVMYYIILALALFLESNFSTSLFLVTDFRPYSIDHLAYWDGPTAT